MIRDVEDGFPIAERASVPEANLLSAADVSPLDGRGRSDRLEAPERPIRFCDYPSAR